MNSQVGTKRNITMTKQWHLGGLSHNRLCDIVGNPIALNKCNKRWCGPFLFMCCKTNQLLSGFILNCNVQENNLYSKILTSYKLLSGHIYICIEIQQETTTCWLPREFSTSKAAFEGHVLNFGMNLFYQQISTFLEVPSPNDKWCQKIRPSGPAKKHLHKVSSLSFVPSVCKTTIQDFSTWKKKKQEKTGGLLHQVFPKSTIHWTETLPQKPTKNPGGGHPQCYLDSPGFSSLAPFKSSWICCLLQYCTFIVPDTWNFLELM